MIYGASHSGPNGRKESGEGGGEGFSDRLQQASPAQACRHAQVGRTSRLHWHADKGAVSCFQSHINLRGTEERSDGCAGALKQWLCFAAALLWGGTMLCRSLAAGLPRCHCCFTTVYLSAASEARHPTSEGSAIMCYIQSTPARPLLDLCLSKSTKLFGSGSCTEAAWGQAHNKLSEF